eukprot:CAMPEP_0184308036 /NCGR_PEP_ID=MMETSP1049-20130417/16610_1 /TAXON_ID=77928 /ORGANISM="Proteomonas sulcata, Strain CCMP704" /LENGTH=229 /DNA_ID=CAMNT_0026620655 /DNA_START=102 /DNA_END=788 /DNA_ORIENTATION=+
MARIVCDTPWTNEGLWLGFGFAFGLVCCLVLAGVYAYRQRKIEHEVGVKMIAEKEKREVAAKLEAEEAKLKAAKAKAAEAAESKETRPQNGASSDPQHKTPTQQVTPRPGAAEFTPRPGAAEITPRSGAAEITPRQEFATPQEFDARGRPLALNSSLQYADTQKEANVRAFLTLEGEEVPLQPTPDNNPHFRNIQPYFADRNQAYATQQNQIIIERGNSAQPPAGEVAG